MDGTLTQLREMYVPSEMSLHKPYIVAEGLYAMKIMRICHHTIVVGG